MIAWLGSAWHFVRHGHEPDWFPVEYFEHWPYVEYECWRCQTPNQRMPVLG